MSLDNIRTEKKTHETPTSFKNFHLWLQSYFSFCILIFRTLLKTTLSDGGLLLKFVFCYYLLLVFNFKEGWELFGTFAGEFVLVESFYLLCRPASREKDFRFCYI